MKLVNKISLWFIAIVILTTPLCIYISYSNIKAKIDTAEIVRMKAVNDNVANQLMQGLATDKYTQGRPIKISQVSADQVPAEQHVVKELCFYLPELDRNECKLTLNSYYKVGDIHYKICSYNYVTKAKDILAGMKKGILIKMLVIIFAVAISSRLLSYYIFKPLRETMQAIHQFKITQQQPINLSKTNTKEFKELNGFLQKMTDKAVEDYRVAKEFSENASHELQTPLAVIRSKAELLAETAINQKQADMIADIQIAIDKLSKINRSLTLLTKLENQEFVVEEPIKFCRITKNIFAIYEDRIAMKHISLHSSLDKNIVLPIHPSLADILVSNLMSNAIRHNIENGLIEVRLTQQYFYIANTGFEPEIPTMELFQRFKKSNQCEDSIGLGLAIVKQICEVNAYSIQYNYEAGLHRILICFEKDSSLNLSQIALPLLAEELLSIA